MTYFFAIAHETWHAFRQQDVIIRRTSCVGAFFPTTPLAVVFHCKHQCKKWTQSPSWGIQYNNALVTTICVVLGKCEEQVHHYVTQRQLVQTVKCQQWIHTHPHQLGCMQACTLLHTDNNASTPPLSFYRPYALPAAQPTASKHWRH